MNARGQTTCQAQSFIFIPTHDRITGCADALAKALFLTRTGAMPRGTCDRFPLMILQDARIRDQWEHSHRILVSTDVNSSWISALLPLTIWMVIIMVSNIYALQLWYLWWLEPPLTIDICWGLHGSNRTHWSPPFHWPRQILEFWSARRSKMLRPCSPLPGSLPVADAFVRSIRPCRAFDIHKQMICASLTGPDPSSLHCFSLWRISLISPRCLKS